MDEVGAWFPEAHHDAEKMTALAMAGFTVLGFDNVMPLFSVWHEGAALGCNVGSSFVYYISAKGARPILMRYGKYVLVSRRDIERADEWFDRYGQWAVFFCRMVPMLRSLIAIPAGVVGQVWRDGRTQVPLARLLGAPIVDIEPLTDREARAAGQLCGVRGTRDVIDASVVLCAQRRQAAVLSSDTDDLLRLDPRARIVAV